MVTIEMRGINGKLLQKNNVELREGSSIILEFTSESLHTIFLSNKEVRDNIMNGIKDIIKGSGCLVLGPGMKLKIINKVKDND